MGIETDQEIIQLVGCEPLYINGLAFSLEVYSKLFTLHLSRFVLWISRTYQYGTYVLVGMRLFGNIHTTTGSGIHWTTN
jgi:hypothetical protein